MKAQTAENKIKNVIAKEVKTATVSNPLENQIQSSKSKIDQEKERIVKANTILLNDSKKRMVEAEEKYKKATALYEREKAEYKASVAKEKENIKILTSEIKRYK